MPYVPFHTIVAVGRVGSIVLQAHLILTYPPGIRFRPAGIVLDLRISSRAQPEKQKMAPIL